MESSNRRDFLIRSTAAGIGFSVNGLFSRKTYAEETSDLKKIVYRDLGSTGQKVSVISFGAMNMRDPELVHAVIDKGINYIDTAHSYMRGANEEVIGSVMKTKRDKVFLTTKISGREPAEMPEMIKTSLKRLQTDHVDLLLLHNIRSSEQILNNDIMKIFDDARRAGQTRFVGFSTHNFQDEIPDAALKSKFWEAVLVSYNYLSPPSFTESIKKVRESGIAIIGMKSLLKMGSRPSRGSRDATSQTRQEDDRLKQISETLQNAESPLTEEQIKQIKEFPQDRSFYTKLMEILDEKQQGALRSRRRSREAIEDIREDKTSKTTPQQALIKWVLNNPNVDTVIAGMTSFEQLTDDLAVMGMKLSLNDRKNLQRYSASIQGRYCHGLSGCTGCREKCPRGVEINEINRCLGYAYGYGNIELAHENYGELPPSNRVDMCYDCDECVIQCVHGLNLTENIRKARELFA